MKKEICDTTGNPCIHEKTVSEIDFSLPDVQDVFKRLDIQNDESERFVNRPTIKDNKFERSLDQQSTQYDSDRYVIKPEVHFGGFDQSLSEPSVISEESGRYNNVPVIQDFGSKWYRARKALRAALSVQRKLKELSRKMGLK